MMNGLQAVCALVILSIAVILTVVSTNPGLLMKIAQYGLQYVSKFGVQSLRETLADTKIPDISDKTSVDVIGKISYELKNLKITSFDLPDATISTVSDTELKASIVNARLSIHGDWKYRNHGFIRISDHGSVDVKASSITLSLVMHFGYFAISTTKSECNFNVGSLDVDIHGGASWLYKLFEESVGDKIQNQLNEKMCDEIVKEVNGKLTEVVAGFKNVYPYPIVVIIIIIIAVIITIILCGVGMGSAASAKHRGPEQLGARSVMPKIDKLKKKFHTQLFERKKNGQQTPR